VDQPVLAGRHPERALEGRCHPGGAAESAAESDGLRAERRRRKQCARLLDAQPLHQVRRRFAELLGQWS